MSNITRRIEKLEKMMAVGKERKISEIIICWSWGGGPTDEQDLRESLGPPEV